MFLQWKKSRNAKRAFEDQIERRPLLRAHPLRIHLEINDRCNLACGMCARNNEDIPKNTGDFDPELVRRLSPWLSYAHYTGLAGNGEPFLHPRLFEILDILRRVKTVPCIITNGTLLTEESLEKLIRLGPSILIVSFDGGTRETFESIRKGSCFEEILHSLERLSAMKQERRSPFPVVNFLVCIQKKNQNELGLILEHAGRLGALKVDFQTLFPFTRQAEEERIGDLKEIHRIFASVREKAGNLGIQVSLSPLLFGLRERLERQGIDLKPDSPLFCENIWQSMQVDVKGNVRFCCFWTGESIGNLEEKTIPELWNHPEFVALRSRIVQGDIPETCARCHILEIHDPGKIRSK